MSHARQGISHTELAEKWKSFTPPARPSEATLAIYEKHITNEKVHVKGQWGILGCTPELRCLGGKYHRPVTCIDKNPLAYAAMGLLCEPSDVETYVHADWLDTQLEGQFDIVLGDGSMSMLSPGQHQLFLQSVHQMLTPKGLAVLRIHVSDNLQFKSPQEVFDWYRHSCPEVPVYKATKTFLSLLWLDPVTRKTPPHDLFRNIDALYHDGVITREEFEGFQFARSSATDVHYTEKAVFEALCEGLFSVEAVSHAHDYPSHAHHPVYALRKK